MGLFAGFTAYRTLVEPRMGLVEAAALLAGFLSYKVSLLLGLLPVELSLLVAYCSRASQLLLQGAACHGAGAGFWPPAVLCALLAKAVTLGCSNVVNASVCRCAGCSCHGPVG